MKALVYHGQGKRALEDKPKPVIKAPTDAVVKITKTTICGTDLHIMKGMCQQLQMAESWGTKVSESSNKSVEAFRTSALALAS